MPIAPFVQLAARGPRSRQPHLQSSAGVACSGLAPLPERAVTIKSSRGRRGGGCDSRALRAGRFTLGCSGSGAACPSATRPWYRLGGARPNAWRSRACSWGCAAALDGCCRCVQRGRGPLCQLAGGGSSPSFPPSRPIRPYLSDTPRRGWAPAPVHGPLQTFPSHLGQALALAFLSLLTVPFAPGTRPSARAWTTRAVSCYSADACARGWDGPCHPCVAFSCGIPTFLHLLRGWPAAFAKYAWSWWAAGCQQPRGRCQLSCCQVARCLRVLPVIGGRRAVSRRSLPVLHVMVLSLTRHPQPPWSDKAAKP